MTLFPGALMAVLYFSFVLYFPACLDFLSPPLSAPGSPRTSNSVTFTESLEGRTWLPLLNLYQASVGQSQMSRPRGRFTRSKARKGDSLRHQIPAPCPHSPHQGIYIDRCITGGMSLRNGMWHGLRNDIIMRNVIYAE